MTGTDVVIVCEAGRGQTESANARLMAMGVTLAEHWGGKLVCLLVGRGIGATAAALSRWVDEVWVADSPLYEIYNSEVHVKFVRGLVEDLHPRIVLFGHTHIGMDLAPRLASRLKVGLASNCSEVRIESEALYFVRPMYRGRVHAKAVLECSPMVATVQIGGPEPQLASRSGTVKQIDVIPEVDARLRPLRTIEPARTGVDIAKADIIVSGGRGIGERENFALVNDLAEALGGVPACSRPLVDMGWFSTSYQVGLSGNTVKPKLYIACGISGAVEHLHGMKESGNIVAINKDPDAPIYNVAHYGLVGDLNAIVPQLIKEVRAARAEKN